jgi:hypothetical protein
MKKETKLTPGQNVRYIGRGFPGFVKGQPYMVFVDYHQGHEVLVKYNDANIVVSKYHVESINK